MLPLITFLLGGFFTFTVTSVNHRRIHCDDIRKTFLDAVLDTKKYASEYWLSKYDEKRRSDLIGSIVFLQRIAPLLYPMMKETQIIEIKSILRNFVVELRGKDDMAKEEHKESPERVSSIHITSAHLMERYYSFYLEQTTVDSLIKGSIKHIWGIIKKRFEYVKNYFRN